jgi:hypothetical protein
MRFGSTGETRPLLLTSRDDAVVKEVIPPTLEDKLQLGLPRMARGIFRSRSTSWRT